MAKGKFDNVRTEIIGKVSELLTNAGEEVLVIGSQKLCMPIVNEKGDEAYLTITFAVPTGSRDGEAYDGHAEAESYALHIVEQERKAQEAAAKKAAKVAKDAAAREAKRKAKEQKEG